MGLLKIIGSLSRSNSPSRSTPERRVFDEKAVAAFFCHGRADSDGTIQFTQTTQPKEGGEISSTLTAHNDLHISEQQPSLADEFTRGLQHQNTGPSFLDIVVTDHSTDMALDESQDVPLFFSKLPAELRNNIYHCALVPEDAIDISGGERPATPALLQTCRQIRHEASGIYYGNTVFTHHLQTHFWRTLFNGHLMDWLKALGPETCAQLRHLTLNHKIIDATEQVFSAFDSFVKVTGSVEVDCREFLKDLTACGVPMDGIKIESATDAIRRRRIATAGNDTPWVRALEAAKAK